jgi:hypothetical protein
MDLHPGVAERTGDRQARERRVGRWHGGLRDVPVDVSSDLYRKARMWLRRIGMARNPAEADRAAAAARIREDPAWRASST